MKPTGQRCAVDAPPLGKSPGSMRLGEAQSWSGHFGRDKNLLHLPEFEPKPIASSLY